LRGRIFISYRRDDAPADARNIRDRLARKFGESNVFMDVDNLFAGQRFDQELDKALSQCQVVVAVIGRNWMDLLTAHRRAGGRDYVREEIGGALRRQIAVIPVLVGREGQLPLLPRPEDLPAELRDLLLFQKHGVAHETFGRDADQLNAAIGNILRAQRSDTPWKGVAVGGMAGLAAAGLVAAVLAAGLLWFSQSGGEFATVTKAASEIDASAKKARDEEALYRTSGQNTQSVIDDAARRRVQWYERQAAQGDAAAMAKLGAAYEAGVGMPKSEQAAITWYRKAADAGNEEAKAKLKKLKAN
jgi:hypothetical protein